MRELVRPAGRDVAMRHIGEGGLGVLVARLLTPWATALAAILVAVVLAHGSGATAGRPQGVEGPVALLGSAFDPSGCTTAPQAVGRGTDVFCPTFRAVLVDGTVRVVSLYASGSTVVGAYEADLPEGLTWNDALRDVIDRLGTPRRVTSMYGTPTLVYAYRGQPYHSLELQFDARDELVRINASLTR